MIGIDLGTTNSLCAVFEDGAPKLLRNGAGGLLTPSVVGVSEDEQVLVGSPARELRVTRPDRCAGCFKRWMGTDKEIQIGSHRFTAPELSSLVLRSLKQDAETHLGREVTEAVVTVPAYFNDNQRKATRLAGELAGLNVRRIINEPTAAALTYGFHDRQAEKNLIVIDLGGGTFDVTVMEVFEGTLEIVATAGESFLGGEDFTDRMVAWVLGQRKMALESAELNQPLLVSRLRAECERAKCALAGADEAPIRFPDREGRIDAGAEPVVFSRARFAEITKVLMDRLAGPIHKALRDSGRPKTSVNEVILVGGATRMPLLRDFVRDLFGKDPLTSWDPDHVVALGASIQSALILDDKSVEDMVMTDVCPFTLGVEICKEFGAKVQDGYYLPVIHRNTTIPVSKEEIVNTLRRNQTEVLVKIYQGEGRRVKDNLCLGELTVKGIPPGEAGQPVHLRFTYDLNGILEVEAFLPQTGKKFQTVLTQHTKGLSPDAMQEAVRNLQKLKVYPRHEVATQNLIRFTERVIGEVNPFDRQSLEEELDRFEMSCSSGDRELFEQCRQSLILMLSGLGFPPAEDAETRTDDDA